MPDPVLIILHQEHSTPGRIGRLLRERGYPLDIRRPRFGDPLPATLCGHSGAAIFGGPMSANDPDEWVKREIDWIKVPLSQDKPFLGVCLGAQMMVKQLGGTVQRHRDGIAEIGYWPIKPTEAGRALFDWPTHVYHWHSEGFDRPACCEQLAEGHVFENQAVRVGRAFGIQFHPEVTHAMLCRWTTMADDKLAVPGAQDRVTQIAGRFQHDHAVARWLDAFLDHWLGVTRDRISAVGEKPTVPAALPFSPRL